MRVDIRLTAVRKTSLHGYLRSKITLRGDAAGEQAGEEQAGEHGGAAEADGSGSESSSACESSGSGSASDSDEGSAGGELSGIAWKRIELQRTTLRKACV